MKKIVITIILCLLYLLSFSACNKQEETIPNLYDEYEFYDPVFFKEAMIGLSESVGIELDENYNNVVASVENELIPISATSIECRICNQNIGKGFTIYTTMAIEKKVGGSKWVRLKYQPRTYPEWCVIGVKNNKEINYETLLVMEMDRVDSELTEGDYRLVIFLGESNLYVQFKLFNEME